MAVFIEFFVSKERFAWKKEKTCREPCCTAQMQLHVMNQNLHRALMQLGEWRYPALRQRVVQVEERMEEEEEKRVKREQEAHKELAAGKLVQIHSLVSAHEHNGKHGMIVAPYDEDTEKWSVQITPHLSLFLKSSFLRRVATASLNSIQVRHFYSTIGVSEEEVLKQQETKALIARVESYLGEVFSLALY